MKIDTLEGWSEIELDDGGNKCKWLINRSFDQREVRSIFEKYWIDVKAEGGVLFWGNVSNLHRDNSSGVESVRWSTDVYQELWYWPKRSVYDALTILSNQGFPSVDEDEAARPQLVSQTRAFVSEIEERWGLFIQCIEYCNLCFRITGKISRNEFKYVFSKADELRREFFGDEREDEFSESYNPLCEVSGYFEDRMIEIAPI